MWYGHVKRTEVHVLRRMVDEPVQENKEKERKTENQVNRKRKLIYMQLMLTTTYMRCLIKAAGETRIDKFRTEEIRLHVNIQTPNKIKIRWWSHVKRMAPTATRDPDMH